MDWLAFSIVIACLLVSAFFSASETALTGASRASMLRLSKQGNSEAGVVSSLFAMRERMIGALLLGNNIANIGASALATGIFTAWFGEVGVLYATGVMTVMVVIFAEVLPKTIAINAPDRGVAVGRAPDEGDGISAGTAAHRDRGDRSRVDEYARHQDRSQPAHPVADRAAAWRGRSSSSRRQGRKAGPRHVRRVIGSERASGLRRHGSSHRNGDDQRRPAARRAGARDAGHRIHQDSAWREKPENIIGVLHAKDLLRAIRAADGDTSKIDVSTIALPPWFVPEMRPVSEQLKAFRRRKTHFALVVDEYGEVEGMVTLEDILEEIVGDISDEHDVVVAGVRAQPDGSVVVDGSVPIRDLNRAMDWHLPDPRGDHRSGARDSRGPLDSGARPEFHLPRLSLPRPAPRAQSHHRTSDRGGAARGRV